MREALVRLAVLHGIAPEYYDIWGKRHHVSDEALVALLGAIDVTADSHEAIDAALAGAMHERWAAGHPQAARLQRHPTASSAAGAGRACAAAAMAPSRQRIGRVA